VERRVLLDAAIELTAKNVEAAVQPHIWSRTAVKFLYAPETFVLRFGQQPRVFDFRRRASAT